MAVERSQLSDLWRASAWPDHLHRMTTYGHGVMLADVSAMSTTRTRPSHHISKSGQLLSIYSNRDSACPASWVHVVICESASSLGSTPTCRVPLALHALFVHATRRRRLEPLARAVTTTLLRRLQAYQECCPELFCMGACCLSTSPA